MKKSIWILGALLSIAAATEAIKKDPLKGHVANNKIEYFLSVEQGKFILIDRIVLDSRGDNVRGFYGWASQGEDEYYLAGKRIGNNVKGTKLSLSNGEITPFEIKLDASSAKGLSRFGKLVPKDNQDIFKTDARGHSYFGERRFDIYQQPNKSSAILQKNIKVTNKGFKLVEIGSVETDFLPGSWNSKNIWYRIQNGQVDGWVFGLLTAV